MSAERPRSYRALVWREFRKNRRAVASLYGILALLAVAVLADFIANDMPYYVVIGGRTYYPILLDYGARLGLTSWPAALREVDFKTLPNEGAVFPPIPYMPRRANLAEESFSPPTWKHWLGTDQLGRDVASGMVHGSRISLTIGIVVAGIQLTVGILLGGLAGYYGGWIDLALSRNLGIGQGKHVEVRVESFNIFNHVVPGDPNTTFGNANFGKVTSTGGDPRIMQFAAKFVF